MVDVDLWDKIEIDKNLKLKKELSQSDENAALLELENTSNKYLKFDIISCLNLLDR